MVNVRFSLVLLALVLLFFGYTATQFPCTYIMMEGDDFWVLTWDFWQLKLSTLPAFTMWLTDFLTQFYGSPYVGAGITASVLGLTGLLAYQVLYVLTNKGAAGRKASLLRWLALLPPILLGYFSPFILSFQLQWLFFFALALVFLYIPALWGKVICAVLCVPLGFLLMRTPQLCLLQLLFAAVMYKEHYCTEGAGGRWKAVGTGVLLLLASCSLPLIYSQQFAFIPFSQRYTVWGGHAGLLTGRKSHESEFIRRMICLADEQRWEDLLYRARAKQEARRGNATALRFALLAESALGTLPENLFDYPINDENLFLYRHEQNYVALQFNRLFYLNLGVFDEAFHHAQEFSLLQSNGTCFSSLRQMVEYSLREGEWEVAEKFLNILSKSSCHSRFVSEKRGEMAALRQKHRDEVPLRADNLVGGWPLPVEMLRLERYYGNSPHRKQMIDYAICCYMLRGDARSFLTVINSVDLYKGKELPRAYREFLERYSSAASTASPVSNPLETR